MFDFMFVLFLWHFCFSLFCFGVFVVVLFWFLVCLVGPLCLFVCSFETGSYCI